MEERKRWQTKYPLTNVGRSQDCHLACSCIDPQISTPPLFNNPLPYTTRLLTSLAEKLTNYQNAMTLSPSGGTLIPRMYVATTPYASSMWMVVGFYLEETPINSP